MQQQLDTQGNSLVSSLQASVQDLITRWQQLQSQRQKSHDGRSSNDSWRVRLAHFLESTPVHIAALCLLLLDLVLTVLDLSTSLMSCSNPRAGKFDRLYHWGGVAILGVLTARSLALVVSLGVSFLWRPGLVVDGIVVTVAMVLELMLAGDARAAGFIVVVSLWRVIRVIESAFELSNEAIEFQIQDIRLRLQVLSDENHHLEELLVQRDKRIAELEEELGKTEGNVWVNMEARGPPRDN